MGSADLNVFTPTYRTAEMFFAVDREREYFRLGEVEVNLAIRTSRIFRKIEGRWKQVHHHGSIEDPNLLAKYQSAVMDSKAAPRFKLYPFSSSGRSLTVPDVARSPVLSKVEGETGYSLGC